ncbi:MAG: glycoside hydrolase family 2 protein [Candidatus Helarchaeota archaeon]
MTWSPVEGQIMTRWAKQLSADNPLPEYPRPQLERETWLNLNGLWNYAILPKKCKSVDSYDGEILVPFPIESALSGVKRKLRPKDRLWYQRSVSIPKEWSGQKLLLHFGAVDWEATVHVNGKRVGSHHGGYVPFAFEISKFVNFGAENDIVVDVLDPTGRGRHERGKQTLHPYMIYYTAVSGIWQTVWLEPVPETHVKSLKITPDIDTSTVRISINCENIKTGDKVKVSILDDDNEVVSIIDNPEHELTLKIPEPKLWNPRSPFLYRIIVQLERNGQVLDEVTSYCGVRKIGLNKDKDGHVRIELNDEPIFQYGTLDQGYWPDGLYTAPTDEALLFDIEITKKIGFNMIRKHVKVEPLRWYYHCDRLGMLVWQDMPNGGWYIWPRSKSNKKYYHEELEAMISTLYNSPSVIVWVPFNEGWGQFDTRAITSKIRALDPTRLIDSASGWFDKGVGDVRDIHVYPGPKMPKKLKGRAAVIGEFGGLGFNVKDHVWKARFKWSYKKSKSPDKLLAEYKDLMSNLQPLIKDGLCAAVYTQITDVEREINGLLTYDREIMKIDEKELKKLHSSLFIEL